MTFTSILLIALAAGVGLVALVIGGAVLLDLAIWCARTGWILAGRFKAFLSTAVIWTVHVSVSFTFGLLTGTARLLWEVLATALLTIFGPVVVLAAGWLARVRARMAAKRQKVLTSVGAVPPAPLVPIAPLDAPPEPEKLTAPQRKRGEKATPAPTITSTDDPAYGAALEVLGFTPDENITSVDLKMRYSAMAKKVKPEDGFPGEAIAKQLLQARDTIKRAKGWA